MPLTLDEHKTMRFRLSVMRDAAARCRAKAEAQEEQARYFDGVAERLERTLNPNCPECGTSEDAAFKHDCPCPWVDQQLAYYQEI